MCKSLAYSKCMVKPIWNVEHADYLLSLVQQNLSSQEMSVRMSRQFKMRVTPAQVNSLLARMRRPSDPLYRAVPYRNRGSRFSG